ncbi:MAG: hypothetical protein Q4G46_13280, partial [Propionibacteriaceae bacterium]|nr:hypothetical protein [Propionibacteriaceae bacterium]
VLVAGPLTTPSDLRAAHVMIPPRMSSFALRCGPSLTPARRSVGGLTILDVPSLADLPLGLRTIR